jgi:ribosomal protein S18 acetylase RimI-like enzyme
VSLDLRIASSKDAERVAALARDTFFATFADSNSAEDMARYAEQAFTVESMRRELEDPTSTFIWAEQRGIPAGYAKLRRGAAKACVNGPKPVELERIYADPELIGAGVGKTLLHTSIKIAMGEGFQTLWLGVWEHNERAIEFYHRQGFVDAGEHAFLLGNDQQTDRIMQLDLRY